MKLEQIRPTLPPAPYLGGKRILAKRIIKLIDATPHLTYAEPFIGMGGIFFRRDFKPKCEVINDRSKDVATLFRILQRHYSPFMDMLKYQLTTRTDFDRLLNTNPETLTDLERAARFLYLQRTAFGGKITHQHFGVSKHRPGRFNVTTLEPMLNDIFERISGVVIECENYNNFIQRYDTPDTLFFIDPPYWNCENDYGKGMFNKDDFELLKSLLETIKGRFIMTINDVPKIRDLYKSFNFQQEDVRYSINGGSGHLAKELIITNY